LTAEVPAGWLKAVVGVEEIDAWQAERATSDGRPLEEVAAGWIALKAKMLPGDEIWYFASDPESWQHLAGREGYALVRDGDVIDALVTAMN
jgi:hypothetical protein